MIIVMIIRLRIVGEEGKVVGPEQTGEIQVVLSINQSINQSIIQSSRSGNCSFFMVSEPVWEKFGTKKSLGIGIKKFGTEKSLGIGIKNTRF